jgi:hypothetical protein
MASSKAFASVIDHIINLCGLPDDSTMVEFIKSQGWDSLIDIVSLSLDDTNDFVTVHSDGSYKATPLAHHVEMFRGFLVLYRRKFHGENNVTMITKEEFTYFLGSQYYHTDTYLSLFIPRAPKSDVYCELTAPLGGEYFNENGIIKFNDDFTKLNDDTTESNDGNSKLENPKAVDTNKLDNAVVEKDLTMFWIYDKNNPAEIVSKQWMHHQVWHPGDPGCIHRQDDKDIDKYFYVKE